LQEDTEIVDQERATTFGRTINDLRRPAERARSSRRGVAGKSHL